MVEEKGRDFIFRFFLREGVTPLSRVYTPPADVYEGVDHYLILLDLPGVEKSNIHIEVDGRTLHLKGVKEEEEFVHAERILRMERAYGLFERKFTFPDEILPDEVQAKLENGVLRIYLPRVKPRRVQVVEVEE